jgi:tRNA A37 threonylcarbamoyladenosine synthetase subunit TsaC/SUA5/YrdC
MQGLEKDAERAWAVLREGGLVLLPTDVGYGLVACGADAVARIYELKGRPRGKPCVTVANMAILDDVAQLADDRVRVWIDQTSRRLPLAVVSRVRRDSLLLANLPPFVRAQATTGRTIATFLGAGELVSEIADIAMLEDRLVVGSSANTAFTGNNYSLDEVPDSIRDHVDLVIDGGRARWHNAGRLATTMLDLDSHEFLRKGIAFDAIESSWNTFRDYALSDRDVIAGYGQLSTST